MLLELNPDIILFTQSWTPEAVEQWLASSTYESINAVVHRHTYHLEFSLTTTSIQKNYARYLKTLQQWFELV